MALRAVKKGRLFEVEEQFREWRLTREKMEAVPDNLRQAALDLQSEYSSTTISDVLGLNHRALKAWTRKQSKDGKEYGGESVSREKTTALTFSIAEVTGEIMDEADNGWRVSISRPDGCKLSIESRGISSLSGLSGLVAQFCPWRE